LIERSIILPHHKKALAAIRKAGARHLRILLENTHSRHFARYIPYSSMSAEATLHELCHAALLSKAARADKEHKSIGSHILDLPTYALRDMHEIETIRLEYLLAKAIGYRMPTVEKVLAKASLGFLFRDQALDLVKRCRSSIPNQVVAQDLLFHIIEEQIRLSHLGAVT
jgi:hypothetical protein